MGLYTLEVSEIITPNTNLLKDGVTKVFNFDYLFYDPTKKADFETKFLNHFLYREIGQETVDKFQHYLKLKCDETLPYYNMLFETALITYEKTINYNLTDSFTRSVDKVDSLKGSDIVNGTSTNTATTDMMLTRDGTIVDTNNKTNTLTNTITDNKTTSADSTSSHSEDNTITKDDEFKENQSTDNSGSETAQNRKVGSDTPSALLAMSDILTDVYASTAEIENNINSTTNSQDSSVSRNNTSTETNTKATEDTASANSTDTATNTTNATTHDTGTVSRDDDTIETNEGTVINSGGFGNTATKTQDINGSETETAVRVMKGSYGVITEADMLQKHIALQQTLTTIMKKFFEECDDIFFQIL